jgi:hypothetical protein
MSSPLGAGGVAGGGVSGEGADSSDGAGGFAWPAAPRPTQPLSFAPAPHAPQPLPATATAATVGSGGGFGGGGFSLSFGGQFPFGPGTPWGRVCEVRGRIAAELFAAQAEAAATVAQFAAAEPAAVAIGGTVAVPAPAQAPAPPPALLLRAGVGLVAGAAGVSAADDAAPRCAGAAAALRAAAPACRERLEPLVAELAAAVAELRDAEASPATAAGAAAAVAAPLPLLRGDAGAPKAVREPSADALQRLAETGFASTRVAAGALGVLRLHLAAEDRETQRAALEDLLDGGANDRLLLLRCHELFALRHAHAAVVGSVLVAAIRTLEAGFRKIPGHPKTPLKQRGLQRGAVGQIEGEILSEGAVSPLTARSNLSGNLGLAKDGTDAEVVAAVMDAAAPPPLTAALEGAADAALALCDAFVYARAGIFNMRASGVLNKDTFKANRKVLSLAAVAARERWSCAMLQEMPGKSKGVANFRALLRRQTAFARWAVVAGESDPSFQAEEAPVFMYDLRCWAAVENAKGVAVAMLGRGEGARRAIQNLAEGVAAAGAVAAADAAAAAGTAVAAGAAAEETSDRKSNERDSVGDNALVPPALRPPESAPEIDVEEEEEEEEEEGEEGDEEEEEEDGDEGAGAAAVGPPPPPKMPEFSRRPGLVFLRSAAHPECYLALVSVHSRPFKPGSDPRDDARELSGSVATWVRERAQELGVAEGSYVCVVAGDHNLGPSPETFPNPRGAFDALAHDFRPVPFVNAAGAAITAPATNVADFSRHTHRPRTYDHAFISRGDTWVSAGGRSLSHMLVASVRVCNVAAAPYSRAAEEVAALAAAVSPLAAAAAHAPCEPLVCTARNKIEALIVELRKAAKKDHWDAFSDHKPLTLTLSEAPALAASQMPAPAPLLVPAPLHASAPASALVPPQQEVAQLEGAIAANPGPTAANA